VNLAGGRAGTPRCAVFADLSERRPTGRLQNRTASRGVTVLCYSDFRKAEIAHIE
jgi:hypothetical protein